MNGNSKNAMYMSARVRLHVDKIFQFVIMTGLQNIFEFRRVFDLKASESTLKDGIQQENMLTFFPGIEKFRNNIDQIQDLMGGLSIPVQLLSHKNQKATLSGIQDYLNDAKGRNIFLSECIALSSKVLAETRGLRDSIALVLSKTNKDMNSKKKTSENERNIRRLLSIKHDLAVWKFVMHILTLINLSAASFTYLELKNYGDNTKSGVNSSKSNDELQGRNQAAIENEKKLNDTYYECILVFLKVNEYQAKKYFQLYSENGNAYDKKISISKIQLYKEDDQNALSPIEYYMKDDSNNADGDNKKSTIPDIFANYFFHATTGSGSHNESQQQRKHRIDYISSLTNNTSNANSSSAKLYSPNNGGSNFGNQQGTSEGIFSDDMGMYSSLDEDDVNNTNLHDVSVVALSDDGYE